MAIKQRPYKRVQSTEEAPSKTKQSFQFDADPNRLMQQYHKTGNLDLFKQTNAIAQHGDFSTVPDFFTALLQVQEVKEEFMGFPSALRSHFDNDPVQMLEMLADPDRVEESIELGLRPPEETEPIDIPQPPAPPPETPPEVNPPTPPEGE